MSDLMKAVFDLMLAMAKAEAEEEPEAEDNSLPILFEDEIAEILNTHKGEKIQIHFHPEGPLNYRYYEYKKDKDIVFTIYDALESGRLVTVNGTDITTI